MDEGPLPQLESPKVERVVAQPTILEPDDVPSPIPSPNIPPPQHLNHMNNHTHTLPHNYLEHQVPSQVYPNYNVNMIYPPFNPEIYPPFNMQNPPMWRQMPYSHPSPSLGFPMASSPYGHLHFDSHNTHDSTAPKAIAPPPSLDLTTRSPTKSNSLATVPHKPEKNKDDDDDGVYVDITEYLNLPQGVAAKKLNIPTSTLSKRWTDAVKKRKWPYRALCKLDKEITTLLMNIPRDAGNEPQNLSPEIQNKLGKLMRQRQENLKPVLIRLKNPPPELLEKNLASAQAKIERATDDEDD